MDTRTRGQVIRDARLAAGLSQTELARRLGYASNATVSNLELDRAPLTIDVAVRIAQACNVPTTEFLAAIAEGAAHVAA